MLNGTGVRYPISVLPDDYEGGRSAVRLIAEAGITDNFVLLCHNAQEEAGLFRSNSTPGALPAFATTWSDARCSFRLN